MTTTADQHLNKLLELPFEERAKAARILLESLDEGPPEAGVAESQAAEIARRLRSLADGTANLHDWDEVREGVRARLRGIRKP